MNSQNKRTSPPMLAKSSLNPSSPNQGRSRNCYQKSRFTRTSSTKISSNFSMCSKIMTMFTFY